MQRYYTVTWDQLHRDGEKQNGQPKVTQQFMQVFKNIEQRFGEEIKPSKINREVKLLKTKLRFIVI